MFCAKCGTQTADNAAFCVGCGTSLNGVLTGADRKSADFGASTTIQNMASTGEIPLGVKGWSWGAFLLNWVWAIGNRTWWGLLALVPYVGLVVAIWLGFKGREMAWKNRKWDSLEQFNRVQKKWSKWGVGLVAVFVGIALIGILAAIAIPSYQNYINKARLMNPA